MKKFFLLPLAVALLAIPVSAHEGNGPFLAVQWGDGALPTIDGNLSEWEALPDYFAVTIEDARSPYYDTINKADLDLGFWGGYNASNDKLYGAAWAFDDKHSRDDPDGTDCICNDDGYEFFTDADHGLDDTDYGSGWWMIAAPPVNGVSIAGGGGPATAFMRDTFDFAISFTGDEFGESTYYYEVEFTPWDVLSFDGDGNDSGSVQSTLDPGEIIHWEMIIGDDDAEESDRAEQYPNGLWKNDGWWSLGAGAAHSTTAPDWELDTDVFENTMTAVESQTWGRLKSRF
jgi:hypothetical protein